MWIDLWDKAAGMPISVDEAIRLVRERYDAGVEAEGNPCQHWRTGEGVPFSFRHAVVLCDPNGKPLRRGEAEAALAHSLLAEYGRARGGVETGFDEDDRDFGNVHGYAMEFWGGPTEPTSETRLKGKPSLLNEQLAGNEEWLNVDPEKFTVAHRSREKAGA